MSIRPLALACLLVVGSAVTALACLWDYDTLQMERLRFPGALEIITGKFVRHSKAYYEWRITDRKKKLESQPDDPALLDDLAVAYAKLGRPEEGIAVLESTLSRRPDRYETLSNLGTLHFFAGDLEQSKKYIRRALEINPDAHFGRERYQLLLTEYVQQSSLATKGVMCPDERLAYVGPQGFAAYVLDARLQRKSPSDIEEIRAATKGVLGMMHFADFESPILLEALGDLLMVGEIKENMTQLAARAYLRAAQLSKDNSASEAFRKMASDSVEMHEDFGMLRDAVDMVKLQRQLGKETADAHTWFAEVAANESRWVAENRDVDREFAAKYYDSFDATLAAAERQVQGEWHYSRPPVQDRMLFSAVGLFCVALLVAVTTLIGIVAYLRRRLLSPKTSTPIKSLTGPNPL